MSLFKRKRRDEKGRVRLSSVWYGDYTDADGKRRRVKLLTDRGESELRLAKYRTGVLDRRLGLVSRFKESEKRPLLKHLDEYETALKARGRDRSYRELTLSRIRAVTKGCDFKRIPDLSAEKVNNFLAGLRGKDQGLGTSTTNHYLVAMKGFAKWLCDSGRTGEHRLAGLKVLNANADLRHERRALSADEATLLIQTAETAEGGFGMSGPHRALAYRVALTTGLRADEIRSLTWRSFDLQEEPTVTVEAAHSKNRQRATLPLTTATAEALRMWRRMRPFDDPVFPLPARTADMIREDLAQAGIIGRDNTEKKRPIPRDEVGRFWDFHCLRHTFGTWLGKADVALRRAQMLMRHSDPKLTQRYSHLEVAEGVRPSKHCLT